MAISVRSYSTRASIGSVNTSLTPGTLLDAPSGLAIGDYFLIGAFFAQGLGTTGAYTPDGFTKLTDYGSSGNRLVATFGKMITNSTDLADVASGVYLRSGATSTRIVFIGVALTGVASVSSLGTIAWTNSSASTSTFSQPATGDEKIFFVAANNSSPSPSPVHSAIGGTKVVQADSRSSSGGTYSDSQFSCYVGGTGASFSAAVTNSGSVGIGFTQTSNAPPSAAFTATPAPLSLTVNASTSTDVDGSIVSYAWDYGDGGTATGVTPSAHTYATSGRYTVTLTVTDNVGATNTTSQIVAIPDAAGFLPPPSRKGYLIVHPGTSFTMQANPAFPTAGTPVAVGDWMIAVFTGSSSTASITPPSGWTELKPIQGPNSLRYAAFGRIRQAGDEVASYTFTANNAADLSDLTLMWGAYANSDISKWRIGNSGNRSIDFFNTAPSIAKARKRSLVLGLSIERTTETETGISGLTGANEWFFMQQPNGWQLQTLSVAYVADLNPAGPTPVMEWQYPNSQPLNGAAFQIALPPVDDQNTLPVADFTTSLLGLALTVDGSLSSDADGTIASYAWDFGDGGTATGVTPSVHTYVSNGTYTVTLTVTDNDGGTHIATKSVVANANSSDTPVRKGYTVMNPISSRPFEIDPANITAGTSIAVGDWMIMAFGGSAGTTSVTPPAGWTTLQTLTGPNTLRLTIFGHIRQVGETTYSFNMNSGTGSTVATLMWGSGAVADVTKWRLGALQNRSVDLTNVAPSVPKARDRSLVLGISFERTNATETSITSLTNATEWYFIPQYDATQIQTVSVAYIEDVSAGATPPITWVYPNSQTLNGAAMQITLPPSTDANTNPVAVVGESRLGLQATVNGSGSYDLDGTIVSYAWDYGDGATATGVSPSPHTYATNGTYTISLTVTDNDGATATDSTIITVESITPITVAADEFNRTTSSGWGTADIGGSWTLAGTASEFSTNNQGVIATDAIKTRMAYLNSVSASDVSNRVDVTFNQLPVGGNVYVSLFSRYDGTNNYELRGVLYPSGAFHLQLRCNGVNLNTLVTSVTVVATNTVCLRFTVQGSNSTNLMGRAWLSSDAEPGTWSITSTDSTTGLQGSGAVGLGVYVGAGITNTPYSVLFDHYSVMTLGSGAIGPVRRGYSVINPYISGSTLDPTNISGGTAISNGDWMIAVIAMSSSTTTVTEPQGWTILKAIGGPNTLRYAVYGKIREPYDTNYPFLLNSGGSGSAALLMWGSGGHHDVSSWVVGTSADRTVSDQNTAPGISVENHSLVLGVSVERSAATEVSIEALSGGTEWLYVAQPDSTQLESISVAYIDNVSPAATTGTMTWTYYNAQATNGAAMQIGIPPMPPTQITIGYPSVYRTIGGVNYKGRVFYWDGTAAHDFMSETENIHAPMTVTSFLSETHSPWFSAHRGFSYNYPEETLYAYQAATDWGVKAIEVSVQKSASGTFWCFHDDTTTRTTGYTGTISSMSDAEIQELRNSGSTSTTNKAQPSWPTARLSEVLDRYAATHVILIEDKTYENTTALLDVMDSYGTVGRPATEIFIWKVDGYAGSGFYTAPGSRGYKRWAYLFDSGMATRFATLVTSGYVEMIGMDYQSTDGTLSSAIANCIANGVMPTAHIISSVAQRDRLLGLGMKGLMVSNKEIIPPWYNP